MLHKCTDTECPFVGQRTSYSCGCHQTDEQVLRAEIERYRAALQQIADDFVPNRRSEEADAIEEMRECARTALSGVAS